MTLVEKIVSAVIIAGLAAAVLLPVEVVELGILFQVLVLGIVAFIAGVYVLWANRNLERADSEYLFLLVRRDLRVMVGLLILAVLALAVLVPRVMDVESFVPRPWAIVAIVVAIDLFAVGLIDDAITMRRDRNTAEEARLSDMEHRLDAQDTYNIEHTRSDP